MRTGPGPLPPGDAVQRGLCPARLTGSLPPPARCGRRGPEPPDDAARRRPQWEAGCGSSAARTPGGGSTRAADARRSSAAPAPPPSRGPRLTFSRCHLPPTAPRGTDARSPAPAAPSAQDRLRRHGDQALGLARLAAGRRLPGYPGTKIRRDIRAAADSEPLRVEERPSWPSAC